VWCGSLDKEEEWKAATLEMVVERRRRERERGRRRPSNCPGPKF